MKVKPIFVFGSYSRFVKPDYSGFERDVDRNFVMNKATEIHQQLQRQLDVDTELQDPDSIFTEEDMDKALEAAKNSDLLLVCKFCLGLTKPLEKLLSLQIPMILFGENRVPYLPLDAYEYLYDKGKVQVALDYEDLRNKLKLHSIRNKLYNTEILAFATDLSEYEKFAVLRNPEPELIRERFGIHIHQIKHAELVAEWSQISEDEATDLVNCWKLEAIKIVEPTEEDLRNEAKLYLAIKKLIKEHSAIAVTMVCSAQLSPLPAECFTFAKLRDEDVSAGCEADLTSLLMMLLLQKLSNKPAFMGNVLVANPEDNILAISHCVMPFKMHGFDSNPRRYELRNYHGYKFPGSITAYYPVEKGQVVTLARMDRNLNVIHAAKGTIVSCEEGFSCRTTLKVQISDVREFISKTLGNHQVLVFGDYVEKLGELCQIFEMRFVKSNDNGTTRSKSMRARAVVKN